MKVLKEIMHWALLLVVLFFILMAAWHKGRDYERNLITKQHVEDSVKAQRIAPTKLDNKRCFLVVYTAKTNFSDDSYMVGSFTSVIDSGKFVNLKKMYREIRKEYKYVTGVTFTNIQELTVKDYNEYSK